MKALKIFLVMTLSFSFLTLIFAIFLANSGVIKAFAAQDTGPVLSIPSGITADPSSEVTVPVQFTSNGNLISSMIFSVDYSNTFLEFNPSLPFSITMNLPAGFTGDCTYDLADLDGEIDCFVIDPLAPLNTLPDGVIASIKLETGAAPPDTVAPINFSSNSPPPSFGDTAGQSVPGSTQAGSVVIGPTSPTEPPLPTATQTTEPPPLGFAVYLPLIIKSPVTGCSNLVLNSSFETDANWVLPITDYTAQYTTLTDHSGSYSMQTGIYDPNHNVYSFSSARQFLTIPADAISAELDFYRLLLRDELSTSISVDSVNAVLPPEPAIGVLFPDSVTLDEDVQMVLILDADGYTQRILVWTIENNAVWINQNFDLSEFAGETIQLYFGTFNNGLLKNSAMFVDDVTLTVCR